jgi:hypothetical protein
MKFCSFLLGSRWSEDSDFSKSIGTIIHLFTSHNLSGLKSWMGCAGATQSTFGDERRRRNWYSQLESKNLGEKQPTYSNWHSSLLRDAICNSNYLQLDWFIHFLPSIRINWNPKYATRGTSAPSTLSIPERNNPRDVRSCTWSSCWPGFQPLWNRDVRMGRLKSGKGTVPWTADT